MQSLGDRMKENYENRHRVKLIRRIPVILRLDGKAFHTLTRGCEKPFDAILRKCMTDTAEFLCSQIQGAKFAYTQSDEISILLTDYDNLSTEAWFDYNLQKICSIAAAMCSVQFSKHWSGGTAHFDCRAFNIPKEEVVNYFLWRQRDWERNSLQMLARSVFSHNELQGKKTPEMHEMLHTKKINWANLDGKWKNGSTTFKYGIDSNNLGSSEGVWTTFGDVIISDNRKFIDDLLLPKKEK